jgi:hypothetical protein
MERKTPYNKGLAKVAVQCSAVTFVVNQTLVLRISICGENRHLRQALNRYRKLGTNVNRRILLVVVSPSQNHRSHFVPTFTAFV